MHGVSLLSFLILSVGATAQAASTRTHLCPRLLSDYAILFQPTASAGLYLGPELRKRGIPVVAITREAEHTFFQLDSRHFDHHVTFTSVPDLIEELRTWPTPRYLFVGDERATGVVDEVGTALNHPYRNDPRYSLHRYHKGLLGDLLAERGLTHVKQAYADNVEMLLAWQRVYGKWPVILKPVDSAGTDAVKLCRDETEVREHFKMHQGRPNRLGRVIKQMLIQETLDVLRNEFVVDTVSLNGTHRVFVGGRYFREQVPGGAYLVTGGEVVDVSKPEYSSLIKYAFNVLDAVGWKNGPAHMEIVSTSDGYKLIDFNGRIAGTWPSVGGAATGRGLIDLILADAPTLFALPVFPELEQGAVFYTIRGKTETSKVGPRLPQENEALLRAKLPSFLRYTQYNAPGTPIGITNDLFHLHGIVELSHPDPNELERDLQTLKELDAMGFFVVP